MEGVDIAEKRAGGVTRTTSVGGGCEGERENRRGGVIAVRPVGTRHRRRRPRSFGCDATRRVASRR